MAQPRRMPVQTLCITDLLTGQCQRRAPKSSRIRCFTARNYLKVGRDLFKVLDEHQIRIEAVGLVGDQPVAVCGHRHAGDGPGNLKWQDSPGVSLPSSKRSRLIVSPSWSLVTKKMPFRVRLQSTPGTPSRSVTDSPPATGMRMRLPRSKAEF